MAAVDPAVAHHRAKVAARSRAVRNGECPPDVLDDARRDFAEVKLTAYIERVLAQAPPLTDLQRTRLAELLRPVRRPATAVDRNAVVQQRIAELGGGAA